MTAGGGDEDAPRVAIVGGGLAGLAAAVGLCNSGLRIELFEARRRLGGRATSFRDPETGQLVDHCQHVNMGCGTNLIDFARRTGIAELFRTDAVLHFFGPDGHRYDVTAARWLPAPAHLAPALLGLGYLSWKERLGIVGAMLRLARLKCPAAEQEQTAGEWLRQHGQSQRAIDQFWAVVLVSALGEEVEHASICYARKVFVDGFLASRKGYLVEVPRVPLGTLYGERLENWLRNHGVTLRLGCAVETIEGTASGASGVKLPDGRTEPFDLVVCAVPWRRCESLLEGALDSVLPFDDRENRIEASPITGVHLWFDRPITALPHAVIVDRLSQWVFNRGQQAFGESGGEAHYIQVVISASRHLAGRDRCELVREIHGELAEIWPAAGEARLLASKIVTELEAVFSVRPGIDRLRPAQKTTIRNLMLAGDWTDTGWPSTMEAAVRSGYLAAEAVLEATGRPRRLLVPDLKRGLLSRLLLLKR